MILLACALEKELGGWTGHDRTVLLTTGVGPVEAACAVSAALAARQYELVINAGIAGTLDASIPIGSGTVVSTDRFELTLEDGTPLRLPDGHRAIEHARSDTSLVERMRREGFAQTTGVTVARVTSTDETAQRIARSGAQIESMEGFAVLRAAELAGVAAIELRGISNRAGARERSGWNFQAGSTAVRRLLDALFAALDCDAVRR